MAKGQISDADYDSGTGILEINGSGFSGSNDAFPTKITIKGEGGISYELTNATPPGSVTGSKATLNITGIDRAFMNALLDDNGTNSSSGDTYELIADTLWNGPGSEYQELIEINVSNFAAPEITSSSYNYSNGKFVVTGTGFASDATDDNDVDISKFTVTGFNSESYNLDLSSGDFEVTSDQEFIFFVEGDDKLEVDSLLNLEGVSASDGTTYNMAALEDWNTASTATDVDPTTEINVSNVPLSSNASASAAEICQGEPINLQANPSGSDGSYSFSWTSIPSGFTSNAEDPTDSPTETTVYYVTVDDGTNTHTSNVVVTVNPLPELSSDRSPDPICSGNTFNYTPGSDQNVSVFDWNIDNITGISETPLNGSNDVNEILTNTTSNPVPVKVYYEMTTTAGCVNTDSLSLDVNPNGQVNSVTDQALCNGANITAINFSTTNSGGTTTYSWINSEPSIGLSSSGAGNISAFSAINNGNEQIVANIQVTPEFENGGIACPAAGASTFSITVNPSAQVDPILDETFCHNENVTGIDFTTSVTDGSTSFSWSSISDVGFGTANNGDITAFTADNGGNAPISTTVTVTPEYTNGEVCSGDPETFEVTVNPEGKMNAVSDQTVCNGSQTSYINFISNNTGGVTVFEWSNNLPGFGLGDDGTGDIEPFTATNGGPSLITANIDVIPKFENNNKVCPGTPETFNINVNPSPDVSFSMPQSIYRDTDPADTITGATPPGGTFSGPGIIASDSTFHPSSAGIGEHTISYTYTDGNNCSNTASNDVDVVPPGGSIIGLDNYYCDYAEPNTIYGQPEEGGTANCIGCGFTPQTWLSIIDDTTAVVYPGLAPAGENTITFTFENGGTPFDVNRNTTIHAISGVADFSGLQDKYCINDDTAVLNGTPAGGIFYGNGITNVNIFDPEVAGTGDDTVQYIYTITSTVCADTATSITTVNDLPLPYFDAQDKYCSNGSPVQLTGQPSGGQFTGPNISGTDVATFTPTPGIIGENTISYTYMDGNGCVNTYDHQLEVTQVANVGIESIEAGYCINADSIELRGEIFGSFEGKGNFSGPGITDHITDDGIGYLIPSDAGVGGPYNITYTYTDSNTCVATSTEAVLIRALPNVSINGLEPLYCVGSPSDDITGFPQGANSSFSYSGVAQDLNNLGGGNATFTPNNVNDSGVVTYTYTDDFGCTNSHDQLITVAPLPDVSFESDTVFCPNGTPVQIIGNPLGGQFSGPVVSGEDTIIFNPANNEPGFLDLTYTYTDSNNCTNSFTREFEITEPPILSIESLESSYCVNAIPDTIRAEVNGDITSEGFFSGNGIFDADTTDGVALFYPDSAGIGGPYEITFTYLDSISCLAYATANVLVRDLPTVSISNLSALYCEGDASVIINGVPESATGNFNYSGPLSDLTDLQDGTAQFNPNNPIDTGIVSYTYTDNFGCSNTFSDTIKVSPLPSVDFSTSSYCVTDTILFFDETISDENILTWSWNFDDPGSGNNTSSLQNPQHFFSSAGLKNIQLSVTTVDGCIDNISNEIELNSGPTIDFTWDNECAGTSSTQFTNLSTDTTSVLWDFGDQTTSNEVNPSHAYTEITEYEVTLHITSAFGCTDSLTKTLAIRPFIQNYPYLQDFEAAQEGWKVDIDMQTSSWEFGTPEGAIINSAYSGQNTWCTNLKGSYFNNELSAITSPCFDFSNLEKPMIKMQIWSATQEDMDGAVLQAKIVNETDWFNIGGLNDVINWYDGVGLPGNPGGAQNVGSYGWTGIDAGWVEVRHKLEPLKGKENVRFRISLGSDGSGNSDGFAFDDIWLGDRSRQVLVESFTNSASDASASINPDFNNMMAQNASDVVDIQYHTNFPGEDPFNSHNPSAPSARTTYYGITEVPWAIINGNVLDISTSEILNNEQILDEQALKDPLFFIDLETSKNATGIDVNATISSTEAISGYNLTAQVAVIESVVTDITGENGETEFLSVLKKMLPNAGGTNLPANWTLDQTEQISLTWNYQNVYDPEKINAVIFIQDENSQEVYQVATDDTATSQVGVIDNMITMNDEDGFIIYPNPAKQEIVILLKDRLSETGYLSFYNNTGQLVQQIALSPGQYKITEGVQSLKPGLYMIRLQTGQKMIDQKKFIKIE